MDRAAPVRKTHTSTSDLLTWSEISPLYTPAVTPRLENRSSSRAHGPADQMSKFLHGDQLTQAEEHSLLKKPCSGYKVKEMNGSGIFAGTGGDGALESDTATLRIQQAANRISQISFREDGSISPTKPTSLAKQREMSGTLQNDSESRNKKHISDAKSKELCGHDIFGPPTETAPHSLATTRKLKCAAGKDIGEPAPPNVRTSVKVSHPAGGQSNILFGENPVNNSKEIYEQKFAELTGNDISKGDVPPGSAGKQLSSAKLREMSGNNIFEDGKAESREYRGGIRKPPGGESSIALI